MPVVVAYTGAQLLGDKVLRVGVVRAPHADVETESVGGIRLIGRGSQVIVELGQFFGVDIHLHAQSLAPHLLERSRDLSVVRILVIDRERDLGEALAIWIAGI